MIGPTSVGKTALSVAIARESNAEIIGADAFQIYSGLEILTAIPTLADRDGIAHHLFAFLPPTAVFDVGLYHRQATHCIHKISERGHLPLVVGGNGLYIRALTDGLSPLPATDPQLRKELEPLPLAELVSRYQTLDPAGADHIDLQNPRRLIRAIEVCLLTGKPFSSLRNDWGASAADTSPSHNPAPAKGVALIRDRADLYRRINQRVETLFSTGGVEEVTALGRLSNTASQVIGYREITALSRGELSREDAIAKVQQITRKYAKRQMTWIRRQTAFPQINLSGLSVDDATSRVLELVNAE